MNEEHLPQREPNLFPQELSEVKCTTSIVTEADQSNEHDNKQDDVGNKDDDNVEFAALDVTYHAALLTSDICSAKL